MYKIYKTIVNLSEAWLKLCHLTFKTLCQFQSKAANTLPHLPRVKTCLGSTSKQSTSAATGC